MKIEKCRLCCVGISNHMEEHLLPSIKAVEGALIASVVSRDSEKRSRLMASHGATGYRNWEEAIAESEIDGVLVAGPPSLNYQVIRSCIENGIPVFSEKPCSASLVDVSALLVAAKKMNSIVHVDYNFRKSTPFENIALLKEKHGQIRNLDIEFNANKPDNVIWNSESQLESFLLAVAIHPIEMIFQICSEARQVHLNVVNLDYDRLKVFLEVSDGTSSVRLATGNNSQTLDVRFRALYESGDVAETSLKTPHKLTFLPAPSGAIEYRSALQDKVIEVSVQSRKIGRDRYAQGYEAQIRDFISAIRKERPSYADLMTSKKAHEIIETILRKTL